MSWDTLRKHVYERDKGVCQVCGEWTAPEIYECGHVIDRCVGGLDELSNLVAMCICCNRLKPEHATRAAYDEWILSGAVRGKLYRDVRDEKLRQARKRLR